MSVSSLSYKKESEPYVFERKLLMMPKGSAIKRLIEESGLSYREIEEQSGGAVSFNQVAAYASGKEDNPTKTRILGLAKALGVSPVDVFLAFLGEETKRPSTRPPFIDKIVSGYLELSERDRGELAPTLEMLNGDIQRRLKSSR